MKYILVILVLCASPCFGWGILMMSGGVAGSAGETDWTVDASLQALYSFESGAMTTDSSPNTNTLVCVNDPTCPSANTTEYQELSQSANCTATGTDLSYYITQSNLNADFPGNGTGDDTITIGGWVRITTLASSDYLWNIYDGSANVFGVYQTDSAGTLRFLVNGSSTVYHNATVTATASSWYFVAMVYDGSDLSAYVQVSTGGGSEFNSTTASVGGIDDMGASGEFDVGGQNQGGGIADSFIGQVDGLAVFTRAFTQAELDSVFTNGWDGDGW